MERYYVNNDRRKDIIITPQDKLAQETLAYIDRLKEACNEAIRSFTRMETLYKLKCDELKTVKAKTVREFAEKLKALPQFEEMFPDEQVFISDMKSSIDELVKEVCGE